MSFLHDKCYTFSIKYYSYHILIGFIQTFSPVYITRKKCIGKSRFNSVSTIWKFTINEHWFLVLFDRYIPWHFRCSLYNDVTMAAIVSQIAGVPIVYSNVYSGADQRKHQSSASLAFLRGIHRWPVNSPYIGAATRKMFPFDDVILLLWNLLICCPMYMNCHGDFMLTNVETNAHHYTLTGIAHRLQVAGYFAHFIWQKSSIIAKGTQEVFHYAKHRLLTGNKALSYQQADIGT